MASSIAVVGLQNIAFRPLQLPIPDEHACLDRDGYGFSKYLMEEVTRYYQRQNDFLDVVNLRLSSVCADFASAVPVGVRPLGEWSLASITVMTLPDAVRAFRLAAEAPYSPGLRILNATGPNVWANTPTGKILRHWWGQEVDLSYFNEPGNMFASVFDSRKIQTEFGFVAVDVPDVKLHTDADGVSIRGTF
jgi:nucleoside-diphosphate-sugar epimerase